MGIYHRADSRFWWMRLKAVGCRSTGILIDAETAEQRAAQKADAEAIYYAAMTTQAKAKHGLATIEKPAITFTEYAAWFDRHVIARRRGAVRDREILKHLKAWFGAKPLEAITRSSAQEYISARLATRIGKPPGRGKFDRRRTVSPNTVNREIDILKGMLRDAVPRYLEANPLAGMKKLRVPPKEKPILEARDEAKLLAVLTPIDRALLLIALDSLVRLSDVLNLHWTDIKQGELHLRDSKTGPYTVPLSDRALAALQLVKKRSPYIFKTRRTKDPRNTIRLMLRSACKRAGIDYGRGLGITFHTATRASGATRMLRAGVDPKTVQSVGNWKDFRAMQTYLQTDDRLRKEAVNRVKTP